MKHSVIVIGLGRFGGAAARELMALGHEVLAIDNAEALVNEIAPEVTHAQELDASDEQALRDVGAGEFEHAIVAISSTVEASIFATMALKNLGVRNVIAKAANQLHGRILERVGANRVVYPEREIGARVAHSFSIPHVVDYLDVAPRFGIVKVAPPASFLGKTLRELDLPTQYALTPVALRRGKQVTVNPHRDERIQDGDELILIGLDEKLELLER
jgi:trk system potassium uptake protein TrkA